MKKLILIFIIASNFLNAQTRIKFSTIETRSLTINGTSYNLLADRTWTVGDLFSTSSYTNPSWISSLAWSKISGTPTTLSGYGITDPIVLTSGSYANPSWITSLAWSKITGTPTTLSGYGITDAITASSVAANYVPYSGASASVNLGANNFSLTGVTTTSNIIGKGTLSVTGTSTLVDIYSTGNGTTVGTYSVGSTFTAGAGFKAVGASSLTGVANTGTLSCSNTATFSSGLTSGGNITASAGIKSTSKTSGIGYAAGSGSTVTQGTNRTTGVVCNSMTGQITLVSAAGSTTPQTFTVTCVNGANDVPMVCQKSGTDKYMISVTRVASLAFDITFYTTGGTTTEQPVFSYVVMSGQTN